MALTTHEKIRTQSGFQSTFVREALANEPNGINSVFYVNSDDNVKFVPSFNTGATIAGVSDVQVFQGLSGVYGVTRLEISAIDIDQGAVQLSVIPVSGASLTISYSSSSITDYQIDDVRRQAEAIVNKRLVLCYGLPLSPTPSSISSLATRLASALLLIRGYGTGARDTASDGYRLYELLMGSQQALLNTGSDTEISGVGEIGMICTPGYQLVDDDGNVIPRNDDDVSGDGIYTYGGRVRGRLYDITEENFRFKDFQNNVNTPQPGSGL